VKDTLLWTYLRLIRDFPTDPAAPVAWPDGCENDRQVTDRVLALTGKRGALDEKVAALQQLDRFERSRTCRDPKTGASLDEARVRFKLSQAAWASRFEGAQGRRLRVEDDLIEIDWDKTEARRAASDAKR